MKIKQTQQTLSVVIKDDCNTFFYLKSVIDKNFKNKIGNKNKIIIFNDSYEEVGRKYFLKLLSKIYIKKTDKKLKKIWQIEKAVNKTIKITLLKTNQIQEFVKLHILFREKTRNIEIKMDCKNRLILKGMQNIFYQYKIFYYPSLDTTYIQNIDLGFIDIFKDFIQTKEIFGNFIDFSFDDNIIKKMEQCLKFDIEKKRGVDILLDDFYKKLHCKCNDPYEKIRKSYLLLTKKYHPDKIANANALIIKLYSKKFQEIQQAYKTIKEYYRYTSDIA